MPKTGAKTREKKPVAPTQNCALAASGGFRFATPAPPPAPKAQRARVAKERVKVDPKLVAAARELRDRYLEQVNNRLLIAPCGKYGVSRALAARGEVPAVPLLKAG